VKEFDITKLGWPVAHPKFNNLPSAKIKTPCPSGNTHLSNYGLILTLTIPGHDLTPAISISLSKWPIFPTIALFFIYDICVAKIIFLFPVHVTNISPSLTIVSNFTTAYPSIHAYNAQIGSTSVTYTLAPADFIALAHPLPTSP